MEPIVTTGLCIYITKDVMKKLLGPAAEYLGGELQEFTRKRIENVGKIFRKAEQRLGKNINLPGQVSPKVLKVIVNEGSYCEDEVAVEYFGGILASSRTELVRDDRGSRIAKFLDGMSTYQIRSHYIIYSFVKKIFSESGYNFNLEDRHKMRLFIPMDVYINSMQFDDNESESQQLKAILSHTFFGLHNDGLINEFKYGSPELISKGFSDIDSDGILVEPSAFGAELYLWGYGEGNRELSYALNNHDLGDLEEVPLSLAGVKPASREHIEAL